MPSTLVYRVNPTNQKILQLMFTLFDVFLTLQNLQKTDILHEEAEESWEQQKKAANSWLEKYFVASERISEI